MSCNKCNVILLLACGFIFFIFYSVTMWATSGQDFWKTVDLLQLPIPNDSMKEVKTSTISNRINVLGIETFYQEVSSSANSPSQSLLFLHGAAFSSKTWVTIKTTEVFGKLGYRVIAVDLPGYGETKSQLGDIKPVDFLREFINLTKLKNVILISPSMSGSFSIPYLAKYSKEIDGLVTVAPVINNAFNAAQIKTPTLILYGEKDLGLGPNSATKLSPLPNSQVVVLPKASHPAYLDQPEMFNQLLYNFAVQIKNS